jgi:cysteine-rich repeat protein
MGNTLGAGAEVLPSCGVPDGEDVVYAYAPGTVGQRGVASIVVTAPGEVALAVRTDCEDSASDIACSFDAATSAAVDVLVLGGEPLVVVVDTVGGMGGPVTLMSTFTPDVCNDGVVTGWEDCEDGNATDGDGCSSLCEFELGPTCAAAPVLVSPQAGNTTGGTALFEGSCTGGGGTLELQLASATDQGIYVRSDCDDELTELGCIDDFAGGFDETLVLGGLSGGVSLTIIVDGYYDPLIAGPFTLTATWTPEGP